ncbi:MAG TPA: FAD-binding and (Fe-S)-binding domain-containing protein [Myxococcota bacterium]|nr:FAD-binding and (Fe-S)-binding domain-containing protein [Myxococcota bacterium]
MNTEQAGDLARELQASLRGEVRFDMASRALYATDASNYRQLPIGVVLPRDVEDAVTAIELCRARGAPLTSRGGGTSLAGQTCNAAVVVDFSKYVNALRELDADARTAWVEPGLVLDELRDRAEQHHLTFGPDPSTHSHCTLGGMIGNDSCGVHSMLAGPTADNVHELEVLTYLGARFVVGATSEADFARIERGGDERARLHTAVRRFRDRWAQAIRDGFPKLERRVSGYNLPALLPENGSNVARALVGSEGTLVTVLGAKLRLVPSPRVRRLVVLGYPSIFEAADHIPEIRACRPIGLEGIDDMLVDDMIKKKLHPERERLLPRGRGWLLVEVGGETPEEAESRAHALMARLEHVGGPPAMKLCSTRDAAVLWHVRESGLAATARVPGEADTWEGWEDSAVPPEYLGKYLRELRALLDRFGYRASLYGHFGQGCVHTRIPFDLKHTAGIAKFRSFVEHAADLVVAHGGSLSGEHGDGQSRAELLPRMFGPELMRAFTEWKELWDPSHLMNPGKLVSAYKLDENLRYGSGYRARELATHFRFPDDKASFAVGLERCVGVGECRRLDGGVMCPSYMATREEQHSTRGRARLLFEMCRGDALRGGWQSDAVKEALDLCLACKGCKGECPMNVDMATYKAEFLSHYYERHFRPRSAHAFGGIARWARLAAPLWWLANPLARTRLLKWLAGIHPRRTPPRFAPVTFRAWWRRRRAHPGTRKVLLFVDTFSNHFQPEVAVAAVEVLEHAGFQVAIPDAPLCCGRPLYDYGMLARAKRTLESLLTGLEPALREGMPIVVLEPSCLSVMRDELPNLLAGRAEAGRLGKQAWLLPEFLLHHAPESIQPALGGAAFVQAHCHQRAVLDFSNEQQVLRKLGLDVQVIDGGCCGMAGAFGYEDRHYDVSVACAKRKLLPALRAAPDDALVVADGFSCREQIRQLAGRTALHTAQVLAQTLPRREAATVESAPDALRMAEV